jgi:hypothetical protein
VIVRRAAKGEVVDLGSPRVSWRGSAVEPVTAHETAHDLRDQVKKEVSVSVLFLEIADRPALF